MLLTQLSAMPAINNWSFWTAQSSVYSLTNGKLWRIWMILPLWATEFRELARRIWQHFPWKTVGPSYHTCWVVRPYQFGPIRNPM